MTSGTDTYVQCTSPIRRYFDLVNQYHLKARTCTYDASISTRKLFQSPVSQSESSLVASKESSVYHGFDLSLLEGRVSEYDQLRALNAVKMVIETHAESFIVMANKSKHHLLSIQIHLFFITSI